ncbi:MAG: dihydroorotate dehydrogenase electron transfer subunit [Calditrichaeota bacterium]|nr:MAG: dihydroorotate dehydrogenase electron transfer subunit [Calditrichota bacterium]
MPMAKRAGTGLHLCEVLDIKNLSDQIYLMRLSCPAIATYAEPAQFVNVRVGERYIPLLRKPFSICRKSAEEGWFEILWRVVGRGTELMSRYQPGDRVDVLGPLGRGFAFPRSTTHALLVGGGLGVAPLPFLAETTMKAGTKVEVFLGARTASELALVDVFRAMEAGVHLATEDGSQGTRGLVTDLVVDRLQRDPVPTGIRLFGCGPTGLLRRLIELSMEFGVPGYVSLETMMGCGFGICMGCPVKVRERQDGGGRYRLTCTEGPVFDTKEVEIDD